MELQKNTKYVSPDIRIAPVSLERCFLTVSANVPGATISDVDEEDWIVS